MAYKNIEDRRKYHKEYMKQRRHLYKQHKMCTECGLQDILTIRGSNLCINCREKRNGYPIDWDKFTLQNNEILPCTPKEKRNQRFENGLCYKCGKPVMKGLTKWSSEPIRLCKDCYNKNIQSAKLRKRELSKPVCQTKRAQIIYDRLKAENE